MIFASSIILHPILCFSATEIVWNGIEKVSVTSFENMEIGEIDSIIIGNHVYVSIARPPKSGCGDSYILKCTFSMECNLLQTILTNSPKMEFFEYNTSNGVSNVSMFVGHWKSGKDTRTLRNYIKILLFYLFFYQKIYRCTFPVNDTVRFILRKKWRKLRIWSHLLRKSLM